MLLVRKIVALLRKKIICQNTNLLKNLNHWCINLTNLTPIYSYQKKFKTYLLGIFYNIYFQIMAFCNWSLSIKESKTALSKWLAHPGIVEGNEFSSTCIIILLTNKREKSKYTEKLWRANFAIFKISSN